MKVDPLAHNQARCSLHGPERWRRDGVRGNCATLLKALGQSGGVICLTPDPALLNWRSPLRCCGLSKCMSLGKSFSNLRKHWDRPSTSCPDGRLCLCTAKTQTRHRAASLNSRDRSQHRRLLLQGRTGFSHGANHSKRLVAALAPFVAPLVHAQGETYSDIFNHVLQYCPHIMAVLLESIEIEQRPGRAT